MANVRSRLSRRETLRYGVPPAIASVLPVGDSSQGQDSADKGTLTDAPPVLNVPQDIVADRQTVCRHLSEVECVWWSRWGSAVKRGEGGVEEEMQPPSALVRQEITPARPRELEIEQQADFGLWTLLRTKPRPRTRRSPYPPCDLCVAWRRRYLWSNCRSQGGYSL